MRLAAEVRDALFPALPLARVCVPSLRTYSHYFGMGKASGSAFALVNSSACLLAFPFPTYPSPACMLLNPACCVSAALEDCRHSAAVAQWGMSRAACPESSSRAHRRADPPPSLATLQCTHNSPLPSRTRNCTSSKWMDTGVELLRFAAVALHTAVAFISLCCAVL